MTRHTMQTDHERETLQRMRRYAEDRGWSDRSPRMIVSPCGAPFAWNPARDSRPAEYLASMLYEATFTAIRCSDLKYALRALRRAEELLSDHRLDDPIRHDDFIRACVHTARNRIERFLGYAKEAIQIAGVG